MRKYLVGILAAYAATATLLAVHWSAESWIYHHCFDMLMRGKHGRPIHYPSLTAISDDFELSLPHWVHWYLRVADSGRFLIGLVGFLFACGLILPRYFLRRKGPVRDTLRRRTE